MVESAMEADLYAIEHSQDCQQNWKVWISFTSGSSSITFKVLKVSKRCASISQMATSQKWKCPELVGEIIKKKLVPRSVGLLLMYTTIPKIHSLLVQSEPPPCANYGRLLSIAGLVPGIKLYWTKVDDL